MLENEHDNENITSNAIDNFDGLRVVEDGILCHVEHQGAYTDIGFQEETQLLEQLRSLPWRVVVEKQYAQDSPWLHRIITSRSRSRMLEKLDVPAGGQFLDVGSGWGQITIPLAQRGNAHALDLTVRRLRILKEIARQESTSPSLYCGNILTFPFRDDFFDLIVVNGMLEYVGIGRDESDRDSHLAALSRLCSMLRPDGTLYIGIENATGLKYLLGAPDDHTGRSHFTYLKGRQDGVDARTWGLDEYYQLFDEAGLVPRQSFACFPDYKLIEHMVDLREIDDFLISRGLPAPEHSGVDGALLGRDGTFASLYRILARLGVSRYFAPSFGFILKPQRRVKARNQSESSARLQVLEVFGQTAIIASAEERNLRVTQCSESMNHRADCQTSRYTVWLNDKPITSIKRVPLTGPFDAGSILAVYGEYQAASAFRPVRLLDSVTDEQNLWVFEEYIEERMSLEEMVSQGEISAEDAAKCTVAILDDIWEAGEPVDRALLDSELQALEAAFIDLFEHETVATALFNAFRENVLSHLPLMRTVLTTRDYIGRNIVRAPNGEWVLLDYDLARRSVLFPLSIARNLLQGFAGPEQLLNAKALRALDVPLLRIAASAAECSLQKQFHDSDSHEAITAQFRASALEIISQEHMQGTRREIEAARDYQANLERQIDTLTQQVSQLRRPTIDIMVVNYNGLKWITGFFDSLRSAKYQHDRLRLVFVDNNSTDGSFEQAKRQAENLSIRSEFVQTGRNAGFTGGYGEAFRQGNADYYFVINSDTEMAPDAIGKLVEVLDDDPRAGIAEARQSPLEHPKYYDPITRETSWSSGACMMIRSHALRSIGGGFDESFFMYMEDVDLSWRMWLHGWKCLYLPEAEVRHFTEHLDPERKPVLQHFFSMRNSALMHIVYDSPLGAVLHYLAMLRVGTLSRNPIWHRWATLRAMAASLWRIPHALRKRRSLSKLGKSHWTFFNGWTCGRHERDLSAVSLQDCHCVFNLTASLPTAIKELAFDLPIESHITYIPQVHLACTAKPAVLVYDSSQLHYKLEIPPNAKVVGFVGVPQEAQTKTACGKFEILLDDQVVWSQELNPAKIEHQQWVPFEVPIGPTPQGCRARLTLRFNNQRDLGWGLWGAVQIAIKEADTSGEEESACVESELANQVGPAISIVMPTHNRSDKLDRVIRRLMAQDVPGEMFEVIIVDSMSSDDTPEFLQELAQRYDNIISLRCEKPGAASARNMGLARATGPLVLLLDDDILVGPGLVRQMLQEQNRHPGRILLGKIVAPWEHSVDPFQRYLLQARDVNVYDFPDPQNVPANYFYTACVAIPQSLLGELRFDEGFRVYGVEDIEFGFRLLADETAMVFLPGQQVLHDYYPEYRGYRQKKYKAGYSLGYFLAEHPEHAHRFTFGSRFRKYYHLLRAVRVLTAPVAAALYALERILYREGPLNRWLYRWLYVDLRLQLYNGLLRFRRGKPPP